MWQTVSRSRGSLGSRRGSACTPVDGAAGRQHDDQVLEPFPVEGAKWARKAVWNTHTAVSGGAVAKYGGQSFGGLPGVHRHGRARPGGPQGVVEEQGALAVIGPHQCPQPCRIVEVCHVERVEVDAGPPDDRGIGMFSGGRMSPRRLQCAAVVSHRQRLPSTAWCDVIVSAGRARLMGGDGWLSATARERRRVCGRRAGGPCGRPKPGIQGQHLPQGNGHVRAPSRTGSARSP